MDRTSIKARYHEHPPDTKKIDGYGATERLLEPRRKGFVTFASGLEQPICKGDLLRVIFREQADLHGTWSWYRGLMKYTDILYLVQHPRERSGYVRATREP